MFDPLIDGAFSLLLAVGLPALFLLFVCKGAIIGKPLPTSVFLPGYILAVSADRRHIVVSITVASVGYVCGQLVIYLLSRQRGFEAIDALPYSNPTEKQLAQADYWFETYSGAGIFITNLVPYLGSFICIPAGMASYPIGRLLFWALTSTVLNYVIIVGLTVGSYTLVFA